MKRKIDLIYLTFQGAWAIHGAIGYRQYMGYTKAEAKRRYIAECNEKIFINVGGT
jgi:hypothetical protein